MVRMKTRKKSTLVAADSAGVVLIIHRLRIFLEAENQLNPSPVSTAGLRDALAKFDALIVAEEQTLEDQIIARVLVWFSKVSKERDPQGKTITIGLGFRQSDEDGTLWLEAEVEEHIHENLEGRVPGEKL